MGAILRKQWTRGGGQAHFRNVSSVRSQPTFANCFWQGFQDEGLQRNQTMRICFPSMLSFLRKNRKLPAAAVVVLWGLPVAAARAEKIEFNRDIRPVLSDNCFACHGPDKNKRKSGLRLDDPDQPFQPSKSGDIAIVRGKPDESELVKRLDAKDEDELMPPPESHKTLTPAQKELLKKWIAQGAEYQPYWAYLAPRRPAVPQVKNPALARNPIDAFIQQKLAEKNIAPSPEADKRSLLRRLSLDLTGLPPTPEEVRAFLADNAPDAYGKQVDRLLASPRYGERMASGWLDLARYSDTVGFHGDQNQNAWAFRDYVIDSFNKNKRFDQFTTEQLAGDLLPKPTNEQLVATCFNRLNMMTREGGAQPKEYLAKYTADRIRTVGTAWLGSTFGCCECHDHKFDPLKAKDFYSLGAFFADVKQWGVYMDYGYTPNPDLRGYSNDHPFPPEILVDSPYLHRRKAAVEKRLGAHLVSVAKAKNGDGFTQWVAEMRTFLGPHRDGWADADLVETAPSKPNESTEAAPVKTAPAPSKKPAPKQGAARKPAGPVASWTIAPGTLHVAAIRTIVTHGTDEGSNLKLSAQIKARDGKMRAVGIYQAEADHKTPRYENGFELPGVSDGWDLAKQSGAQQAVWLLDPPAKIQDGESLVVTTSGHVPPGELSLSWSPLAALDPLRCADESARAAILAPKRSATQEQLVRAVFFLATAPDAAAFAQYKALQREWIDCRNGRTPVMVTQRTDKPLTIRVLPRGNWQDETGEICVPATPGFLPKLIGSEGKNLTRLDLAKWLCSPENPLTARVQMNRMWRQFFGNGISAQTDDLGAQGEPPSHPELLDWLAVEFREKGWDMKRMVKLMAMSHTYRQSANLRSELRDADPNNRLLASQNPRRLEAEAVRDNALAIAGLLNFETGGPPCHPYQPAGYYSGIEFPDREYINDTDGGQYRRGVYMHWQRTFLHPMLASFDAPSREDCIAMRSNANSPQQALTLLNDPEFVEAARVFAAKLLATPAKSDAERLGVAFERALARPVGAKERESLTALIAKAREEYKARPEDAAKLLRVGTAPSPANADAIELAAWTSVCRVVLNLHETITRY